MNNDMNNEVPRIALEVLNENNEMFSYHCVSEIYDGIVNFYSRPKNGRYSDQLILTNLKFNMLTYEFTTDSYLALDGLQQELNNRLKNLKLEIL